LNRALVLGMICLALPAQAGKYSRHRYLFAGKLTYADSHSLAVSGVDENSKSRSLRFSVGSDCQWAEPVESYKPGDDVVVDYDFTHEQGVLKAVSVHHKRPKEKLKITSPVDGG
jgi:hypothetical protein